MNYQDEPEASTSRSMLSAPASVTARAVYTPMVDAIRPGLPIVVPGAQSKGKQPATMSDRDARISEGIAAFKAADGRAAASGEAIGPGGVVRRPIQNAVVVNVVQKGNPIIPLIRNVAWEYGDIVPDYQVGATTAVLYLQLKYHLLHPEYIHTRIDKMGQTYSLRIMLVHCDVDNHAAAIKELTKVCLVNNYTMIIAWSAQECARYLEIYKAFERKPPDMIKERVDEDYLSRLTSVLTSVKGINKTDVVTLASSFGSFKNISAAEQGAILQLPGLGDKKAKRLRDTMVGSFHIGGSKKKRKGLAEAIGEMGGQQLN